MFVGKVRTITLPGTLVLLFLRAAFLKSCLSMSEENECLILALDLNHRPVFSILQFNRRGSRVIVAGLFLSRGLILYVSFLSGFFTWEWGVGVGVVHAST